MISTRREAEKSHTKLGKNRFHMPDAKRIFVMPVQEPEIEPRKTQKKPKSTSGNLHKNEKVNS